MYLSRGLGDNLFSSRDHDLPFLNNSITMLKNLTEDQEKWGSSEYGEKYFENPFSIRYNNKRNLNPIQEFPKSRNPWVGFSNSLLSRNNRRLQQFEEDYLPFSMQNYDSDLDHKPRRKLNESGDQNFESKENYPEKEVSAFISESSLITESNFISETIPISNPTSISESTSKKDFFDQSRNRQKRKISYSSKIRRRSRNHGPRKKIKKKIKKKNPSRFKSNQILRLVREQQRPNFIQEENGFSGINPQNVAQIISPNENESSFNEANTSNQLDEDFGHEGNKFILSNSEDNNLDNWQQIKSLPSFDSRATFDYPQNQVFFRKDVAPPFPSQDNISSSSAHQIQAQLPSNIPNQNLTPYSVDPENNLTYNSENNEQNSETYQNPLSNSPSFGNNLLEDNNFNQIERNAVNGFINPYNSYESSLPNYNLQQFLPQQKDQGLSWPRPNNYINIPSNNELHPSLGNTPVNQSPLIKNNLQSNLVQPQNKYLQKISPRQSDNFDHWTNNGPLSNNSLLSNFGPSEVLNDPSNFNSYSSESLDNGPVLNSAYDNFVNPMPSDIYGNGYDNGNIYNSNGLNPFNYPYQPNNQNYLNPYFRTHPNQNQIFQRSFLQDPYLGNHDNSLWNASEVQNDINLPRPVPLSSENLIKKKDSLQKEDERRGSPFRLKYLDNYLKALPGETYEPLNNPRNFQSKKKVDNSDENYFLDTQNGQVSENENFLNKNDLNSSNDHFGGVNQSESVVSSKNEYFENFDNTKSVYQADNFEYPLHYYIPKKNLKSNNKGVETIGPGGNVSVRTVGNSEVRGKSFSSVIEPLNVQLQKLISTIKKVNKNLTIGKNSNRKANLKNTEMNVKASKTKRSLIRVKRDFQDNLQKANKKADSLVDQNNNTNILKPLSVSKLADDESIENSTEEYFMSFIAKKEDVTTTLKPDIEEVYPWPLFTNKR